MSPKPTLEQRLAATRRPNNRSVIMRQQWHSLLYLHWAVDPALLTSRLPAGLSIDTFDGRALSWHRTLLYAWLTPTLRTSCTRHLLFS
jgi:uncharacterized protein YqjF (DUF2071 family)